MALASLNNNTYQIDINDNILIFKTASFKAEKGSVLHSGIYNRELASALSAGGIAILIGLFAAASYKITTAHYMMAALLFGALFIVLRTYIFRETVLELTLDKDNKSAGITIKGIRKKQQMFPISDLAGVRLRHITVQPENPDGIRVVENISLRHGTVIPGFGEPEEFYVAEIEFRNGKRIMVFSSKKSPETEEVAGKLRDFIKG